MKTSMKFEKFVVAALLFLGLGVGFASAGTVFSDSFSDGNRTSSPSWYIAGTTSIGSESVSASTGWSVTSASSTSAFNIVSYLTAAGTPVALSIGDSLSLSFTVSATTVPGAASARQGVRFGLLNSGGNQLAADQTNASLSTFTNYSGYSSFYSLQSALDPSGFTLDQRTSTTSTSLMGGAANTILATASSSTAAANTVYNATLTLQYVSATQMVVSSTVNGNTLTYTASSNLVTSFDTLALFLSGQNGTVTLDNFNVVYTAAAVPEPATNALLLLSGAAAFLVVRARRARALSRA